MCIDCKDWFHETYREENGRNEDGKALILKSSLNFNFNCEHTLKANSEMR